MPFDPTTAVPDAPAASGFDPSTAKPAVTFADSAIQAYRGKPNTSVYYMTPDQYLSLSPPFEGDAKDARKNASLKKSLDKGDDVEEIPTLDVTVQKGSAGVTDQDGRHRALAAKESGLDVIPVAIKRFGDPGDITEIKGMAGGVRMPFDFRPTPIPPPKPVLEDDPNKEYGTILPFAKDKRTGEVELAVPEMIRAPIRGMDIGGQVALGARAAPVPGSPEWSDMLAATSLGARLPPGSRFAKAAPTAAPAAAPATPAQAAHDAGYVLPPALLSDAPGPIGNALAGWGGKIKLQQAASARNQEVTNRLAAKSLGLPEETTLTESALAGVRSRAAQAYKAIEDAPVPVKQDMRFVDDLLKLGPQSEEMAKYFPVSARNDLIKELQDEFGTGATFSTKAGIQAVRRLRAKATSNLKDFSNPDKVELGRAQRGAADAIDGLIERNLEAAGRPELTQAYRAARQLIAKAHDVEDATNTATGAVSARGLATLAGRGHPLSGELKTIADAAVAFPKAFQSPAAFGGDEALSGLDFFGSALSLAHGRPDIAGAILARPLARTAALSDYMQNRILSLSRPNVPRMLPLSALARPLPAAQGVNQLSRLLQPQGGGPLNAQPVPQP